MLTNRIEQGGTGGDLTAKYAKYAKGGGNCRKEAQKTQEDQLAIARTGANIRVARISHLFCHEGNGLAFGAHCAGSAGCQLFGQRDFQTRECAQVHYECSDSRLCWANLL